MPPPNLERLLQAVEWPNPGDRIQTVAKGSVITFSYVGQRTGRPIHDPYPLIIVSDLQIPGHPDIMRGVNLHYLTLPHVRNLIVNYANNPNFSYRYIKGDQFIVSAFRSYKRAGISRVRMLDVAFLKNLLTAVRALDVGEVDQIRAQIRLMMQQETGQPEAGPGEEIR